MDIWIALGLAAEFSCDGDEVRGFVTAKKFLEQLTAEKMQDSGVQWGTS